MCVLLKTGSGRLERFVSASWARLDDGKCLIFRKHLEVFLPSLDLVSTASCLKTWCEGNLQVRRDAKIPFTNEEWACSHMIHRTKLNMADTWSEEVETRLITYWLG